MPNPHNAYSFITDRRIQFAVNLANESAEKNRQATAYECADQAVHKIFGPWLLDYSGAIKPQLMPVYLRLVADVENRMGLHRRRRTWSPPLEPAQAHWPVGLGGPHAAAEPVVIAA